MVEHKIVVNGIEYIFKHEEWIDVFNIDNEISIDYTNLIGESYITRLISNHIGMIKADLESEVSYMELKINTYIANFIAEKRLTAYKNKGILTLEYNGEPYTLKYSEKAIEKMWYNDPVWIEMSERLIKLKNSLDKITGVFWKIKEKIEKLNTLLSGLTPKEFTEELVISQIEKALNK